MRRAETAVTLAALAWLALAKAWQPRVLLGTPRRTDVRPAGPIRSAPYRRPGVARHSSPLGESSSARAATAAAASVLFRRGAVPGISAATTVPHTQHAVVALLTVAVFLILVERSTRSAIAKTRVAAMELWSAAHAHAVAADSFQQQQVPGAAAVVSDDTNDAEHERENMRAAERITIIGTAINVGLSAFKLTAGLISHSAAMVADAGHSFSDLLSDVVTLWTVRLARLPPDDDHPYGHGRFEAVGSFVVAGMLAAAAVGFGTYAYETFVALRHVAAATTAPTATPTKRLALLAAVISIVSKEALYRSTAAVAQRTESQVLLANAWHHRSDAFSSIVALVSIWGATAGGVPVLDPLGGLLVAGMVGMTALRVAYSAVLQLTDTQDLELIRSIENAVDSAVVNYQLQDDVLGLHAVRARFLGSRAWVDLEVETNPARSTSAATQVVKVLRNAILSEIPSVNKVAIVLKMREPDTGDNGFFINGQQQQQLLLGSEHGRDESGLQQLDAAVVVSPLQVEEDVRKALKESAAFLPLQGSNITSPLLLQDVCSVLVHFSSAPQSGGQWEVDIIVSADSSLSIQQAKDLAETAKRDVVQNANGVVDAKVSLELVRKAPDVASNAGLFDDAFA
jgi:cation diffusion facilitator family transporter